MMKGEVDLVSAWKNKIHAAWTSTTRRRHHWRKVIAAWPLRVQPGIEWLNLGNAEEWGAIILKSELSQSWFQ